MFDTRYQIGISPSSGTSTTGYDICGQQVSLDITFISLTSPIQFGGPDYIGEENPAIARKRAIRDSLERSIQENAVIWQELSER